MSEEELAAIVVDALIDDEWEVYQEVEVWQGGGIADIVAVRSPVVQVVECKMTYSAELVGQAEEWLRYSLAHLVSVAIPMTSGQAKGRMSKGRAVLDRYLQGVGIGKLVVRANNGTAHVEWSRSISGRLQREPQNLDRMLASLTEEHKHYAKAGNPESRRWSPFQRTCRDLRRIVRDNPGIALIDAIREMKQHHYASDQSARASLAKWTQAGKVRGLRSEGRRAHLYLTEGPSP